MSRAARGLLGATSAVVSAALLVAGTGCTPADPAPVSTRTSTQAPTETSVVKTAAAPTTIAASTIAASTILATTTTTTVPASTVPATTTTLPTITTAYALMFPAGQNIGYASGHHDYPAADVFANGCGAQVIAPVDGEVLEVRRENRYDAATDNPALRGGRSVTIRGNDGVRYYFAHLDSVEATLAADARIAIGDPIGRVGRTGRASGCHLHLGISPPCPGKEWSVRRGVVWPQPYLDAWRAGRQLSPAGEVAAWAAANPTACAEAMADPDAASA